MWLLLLVIMCVGEHGQHCGQGLVCDAVELFFFLTASCIKLAFSSTTCRSKHLVLPFFFVTPATKRPALPISSVHTQHHLSLSPLSITTSSPGFKYSNYKSLEPTSHLPTQSDFSVKEIEHFMYIKDFTPSQAGHEFPLFSRVRNLSL